MPGTELAEGVAPRVARSRGYPLKGLLGRLAALTLTPRRIPLALSLVVAAVFSPAIMNGFVEWDDYTNLFENQNFRGLHWKHIRWMFTSTLMGHYIPFTWLTFGLDYTLWGMNPLGYHLTNVALHAVNTALFYLVALRLLSKATHFSGPNLRLAGITAALFFALHPLRAESVAWATERRDVLSGCFFLLTVIAYLKAAGSGGGRRRLLLGASVGAYLLALTSKSIVMTLPLVLLFLDIYPLGRLRWNPRHWTSPAARAVLGEKLPYLALGLAGGLVSYYAVATHHYLTTFEKYPWPARIGMAAFSLWFYVEKTFFPIRLSLLYELPRHVDPLAPRFLWPALGVLGVSAVLLALRRRWPGGLAAWIYYGIILGPVTGIVHSGHQLTHDRYSYLSCLGWALVVGAAMGSIVPLAAGGRARPWFARAATVIGAAWIVALASLTWYQVQVWRDTETLWRFGTESDPACSICQINLGDAFLKQRLFGLATERYELALRLRPDRTRVYSYLGLVRAELGDHEGAMAQFSRAVADSPNDPAILTNMALTLINQHRYREAIPRLVRALHVKPDDPAALTNLGAALVGIGKPAAAVGYLLHAVEQKPQEPAIRYSLTRAYLALGETDAALEHWQMLNKLDARAAHSLAPAFSVW